MRVKGPNPLEAFPALGADGLPCPVSLPSLLQAMQLKRLFRQGWLKRGLSEAECESVADHSFSVALMALMGPAPGFPVDRSKAAIMALVHELGEVYAGDLTPDDGVSPEEKARREAESIDRVLAGNPEAAYIRALWDEFEAGESAEARFVKQLDRLEMGVQAALHKAEGRPLMDEFLDSADRAVKDGELRSLLGAVRGAAGGGR